MIAVLTTYITLHGTFIADRVASGPYIFSIHIIDTRLAIQADRETIKYGVLSDSQRFRRAHTIRNLQSSSTKSASTSFNSPMDVSLSMASQVLQDRISKALAELLSFHSSFVALVKTSASFFTSRILSENNTAITLYLAM